MSVVKNVSLPDSLWIKLKERNISLSKAAQLGAEISLAGGLKKFEEDKSKIKDLQDDIDIRDIKLIEQQKKIASQKEAIDAAHGKMMEIQLEMETAQVEFNKLKAQVKE